MAARYLEAMQCLHLIAPERLSEVLKVADGRAGLRSFQEGCDSRLMEVVFSVPDDNFAGSESCCARWQKGMSVKRVALLSYRNLNLPLLLMR